MDAPVFNFVNANGQRQEFAMRDGFRLAIAKTATSGLIAFILSPYS
jgi:hypothetical protein